MAQGNIGKEDNLNVIRHEHKWSSDNIKAELHLLIKLNVSDHEFRYDTEDKYFYIYDNDCYLFIFAEEIEVRCDRDNVLSENQTFTYKIKEAKDIIDAYAKFNSVTMEGEDEED